MLILKHSKTLKTLQNVSISIQIILRELVVSSLKSMSQSSIMAMWQHNAAIMEL
jgi:hypothetical protein